MKSRKGGDRASGTPRGLEIWIVYDTNKWAIEEANLLLSKFRDLGSKKSATALLTRISIPAE